MKFIIFIVAIAFLATANAVGGWRSSSNMQFDADEDESCNSSCKLLEYQRCERIGRSEGERDGCRDGRNKKLNEWATSGINDAKSYSFDIQCKHFLNVADNSKASFERDCENHDLTDEVCRNLSSGYIEDIKSIINRSHICDTQRTIVENCKNFITQSSDQNVRNIELQSFKTLKKFKTQDLKDDRHFKTQSCPSRYSFCMITECNNGKSRGRRETYNVHSQNCYNSVTQFDMDNSYKQGCQTGWNNGVLETCNAFELDICRKSSFDFYDKCLFQTSNTVACGAVARSTYNIYSSLYNQRSYCKFSNAMPTFPAVGIPSQDFCDVVLNSGSVLNYSYVTIMLLILVIIF